MYGYCREGRKDEDFRLLISTVLQYPAQDPLAAVGDVLRLVPQDFSGDIPELEEAMFDVRELSGLARWFSDLFRMCTCSCVFVSCFCLCVVLFFC